MVAKKPACTYMASPNWEEREHAIQFIILHGTWMDDDAAALARLTDSGAKVSCHYYIDYQANLIQLVADDKVAWHAGKSCWGDIEGLNAHSIGIEIANPGDGTGEGAAAVAQITPYTTAQYNTLIKVLNYLMKHYNIPPENVLGHSDIAPQRKTDPGHHFDWAKLASLNIEKPRRS